MKFNNLLMSLLLAYSVVTPASAQRQEVFTDPPMELLTMNGECFGFDRSGEPHHVRFAAAINRAQELAFGLFNMNWQTSADRIIAEAFVDGVSIGEKTFFVRGGGPFLLAFFTSFGNDTTVVGGKTLTVRLDNGAEISTPLPPDVMAIYGVLDRCMRDFGYPAKEN